MSLRTRVVLPVVAALSLAFLAACGSGTHSPVAPPTGAFSNTNFNGSYTFSITGEDIDGAGNPSLFAMAGTITACGCTGGMIQAGTVDLSDLGGTGAGLSVNSNGSSYSVNKDGRGTINLSIANGSNPSISVVLDFVLTSSTHGLISRFDGAGTGSGTIDLQPNPTVTLSDGAYAFSLSGSTFVAPNGTPLATVGAVNLSSGTISSGVQDFNDNATPKFEPSLSGSIQTGSGTTPGTATITSGFGTFGFDVYSIDATHLKLFENDGNAILVGDVFKQSSATLPTGNLVFTASGFDPTGAPFAAGGTISSSASQLTGAEDINDAGTVDGGGATATPFAFSSTSVTNSPSGSGRFQIVLSGFLGGTNFVAYPSDAGLLLLEADNTLNAGITAGVALTQTSGASLAASQGYSLNLTGSDLVNGTELDEIAQFNTTSSGMTGLIDLNDFGVSNPNTSNLSGSYTNNSNGTGSAAFTGNSPLGQIFYYAADSSTILFISVDGTDTGTGTLESQSTPSSAAAEVIQREAAIVRTAAHIRSAAANRRKMEKKN